VSEKAPNPVTIDVSAEPDAAPAHNSSTVGGSMPPRRFGLALTGIVAGGLAFRVGYVLLVTRHENGKFYDSFWYGVTANELKQGQFFRAPFSVAPTAAHPPLTSLLLGSVNFVVGLHAGTTVPRLTMAVLGAAVVLCVGLLGRAVAGPWVGLTAAGLAALAPNFWMPSGIVMSETPAMLFMALILLAVVRLRRSPTFVNAALLGMACAGEALVRAELVLFIPCLVVPAALAVTRLPLRRRFGLLGIGLLATAVVLAPWVGRNLATFEDATYISTGEGIALLGANCPQTYGGTYLGAWTLSCVTSGSSAVDESVQSSRDQHAAVQYAEHHASRLPVVVAARIGRLWDLYQPIQMADGDVNEGRPVPASLAGLGVYYALLPLGVAGIAILRRRRIRQWYLLVPAGVVTVVSALVFGQVRFRAPFEVCLVVLAAPPLVLLASGAGRRIGRLRPAVHPNRAPDGSRR
jgi:4-amino-4-deoxy-L-arabinose transferase-like glycosyltransferase